jgi:hypothetical protein
MIVGLGYKKGSGKNEFSKFLSTHIHCTDPKVKVQEISFASKLKDIAFQLYSWAGLKRAVYYETHREDKEKILLPLAKSPRQLWIELGNKCREIYANTWIDFALNGVKGDVIIITDMGFTNEVRSILNKGGVIVKLVRNGIPTGTDPREVELDEWNTWDYTIDNNGSLDDLYKKAVDLWSKIK